MRAVFLLFLLSASLAAFAQKSWNVVDFGAKGDGKTVNTQSIQKTIDACNREGGGTVVVPNGTFMSATIYLKSNVSLYLNDGAVLKGVADMNAYKQGYRNNYAFIYAEGQNNIAILGKGTIHGHGEHQVFQSDDPFNGLKNRPNTIFFAQCTNIKFKDYTLRNGARWCTKLDDCTNVLADGVTVISNAVANNSAFEFDDCHAVRVANCFIDVGDDGICTKSYSGRGVKNVTITNCVIKSMANGLKLGAVSVGSFEDITVSNCTVYDSRFSGIAIFSVDGARIERVNFSNITMHNVNGGIFLKLGARQEYTTHPGIIRNIIISNVIADGVGCWRPDTTQSYYKEAFDSRIGVGLAGQPGYRIENVQLNNIYMQFAGGGGKEHAAIVMADLPHTYPEYKNWGITPAYAFNCRHVKDVQFNNVRFDYIKEEKRPAIFFEDAEGIVLNHVYAKVDDEASAFFRCKDVTDMFIHSNKPQPVAAPFLSFEGNVSDITIMNNDFHRIKQIFVVAEEKIKHEVRLMNNIMNEK
ncbi:MAG: glycosyl hydrolase family 28 protein [Prolixibacteraceae bacterium]